MKSGIFRWRTVWSGFICAVVFSFAPAQSWAALEAYATIYAGGTLIEGEAVGSVGGDDVTGKITVHKYNYGVQRVVDPQQPLGTIQDRPVRLLKSVNRSSPLLFEAMMNGADITVFIEFYRPDPNTGATERYYTLTLTHARIVSISPHQSSLLIEDEALIPQVEWVSFAVHTIDFEYTPEGITASHSWAE